jgi:hypothetical protein
MKPQGRPASAIVHLMRYPHKNSRGVGIVPAKIAAVIILVLVLVLVFLLLIVLVLVLILVPILLRQSAIGGTAAGTPERTALVSAKAGMVTEHRTDAVEQKPAADQARCRRCGRAEKRSARTKGRAHRRCQTGTRRIRRRLRGIFWLPSIGRSR